VPIETGCRIAERAVQLVGVPFRLRGRNPDAGLDCVGVVAEALAFSGATFDVPQEYQLRGEHDGRISAFFNSGYFSRIAGAAAEPGDILLLRPAPRQAHLAIVTFDGAVHAHAGLARVVQTPLPLPWPLIGHWRYIGD
jgi:murein DD-endopeptidase / murein LD-carboxypeptidase